MSEGFKRPVYWNKYKVIDNKIAEITDDNEEKYIRKLLDSSYEGVKRLFVLAYDNTKKIHCKIKKHNDQVPKTVRIPENKKNLQKIRLKIYK